MSYLDTLREIQKKAVDCLVRYQMIPAGNSVVAAVSGGADSLCLLLLLQRISDGTSGVAGFPLLCAHYNHCLRGEESDEEEAYVMEFCKMRGIPFFSERGDVAGYARENRIGLEEAARVMRYRFLQDIAETHQGVIAVAHTRADRVETILHHVGRGCSPAGLTGIAYVHGNVIRPILDLSREETEEVCRLSGVPFCVDASNRDLRYRRNRIRHLVLPFLRENLDQDIDRKLLRLSELSRAEQDYLQEQAERLLEQSAVVRRPAAGSQDVSVSCSFLLSCHEAMQTRLIRLAVSQVMFQGEFLFPEGVGLEAQMIKRVRSAAGRDSSGWVVQLSRHVVCEKDGDALIFTRKQDTAGREPSFGGEMIVLEKTWLFRGRDHCWEGTVGGIRRRVEMTCGSRAPVKYEPGEVCVFFDGDKLRELLKDQELVLRTRRPGDRFSTWGGGTKTLRKFLIDEKIPVKERAALPLLAVEGQILWIPKIRRSCYAPIDSCSNHVIMFKIVNLQ